MPHPFTVLVKGAAFLVLVSQHAVRDRNLHSCRAAIFELGFDRRRAPSQRNPYVRTGRAPALHAKGLLELFH